MPDSVMAVAATPESPRSLQTQVQQELQTIPAGFYGILAIEDFQTKINQPDTVLIDVRQPAEYRAGHIEGALNIPLRELADNLDQIPQNQPVILYCSTGYRTGMGVMALHLLGYDNVAGFPPSYKGWQQAQTP